MLRRFLPAVLILCTAGPAFAQLSPEKALQQFKVSDGLEITLWASEPMLVNPTCMDIDHKGRVWVCESVNYRNKLRGLKKLVRPEGDRILVLEDTKGAGKADKVTVFYQSPDLIAPLGIAVAPYPDGKGVKVYVCHSPHIYVFEDKDGDGKADGPPKILLTGFGGYDHDHGVHGILIGPDNKLYFSVGDTGVKNLQSADGKGRKWTSNQTDCRAGTIWRCDLDGKNLELIAHNFRNNYEPCVDSFGTIFISDNDDDGLDQTRICYVMPGGNYGYHPRGPGQSHWHEEQPGVVPKVLRTYRGSPTGMCFYEGTLLPKKYWGQPLHTDAGPGRLSAYHLKPKGAGYEVEREDMVTSKDSFFRPSDVCVAPDGSVFISDWYDQGVGGHAVRNLEDGRIYRVAPKGHKPSAVNIDFESSAGITSALASPNLAVRSAAMAKLGQMDEKNVLEILSAAIKQEAPSVRARAFWQLSRLKRFDHWKAIGRLIERFIAAQTDPRYRSLLIRIWMDSVPRSERDFGFYAMAYAAGGDHPSAPVRRDLLLLALRDREAHDAAKRILELAERYDGKDRFYLAALGIAVGQPGLDAATDKRREIILADFEKHFPDWNDKVAGLVWELRPPGMVSLLEKHLGNTKLDVRQRGLIVDILGASPSPDAGPALLRTLAADLPLPPDVQERALAHLEEHMSKKWSTLKQSPLVDKAIDQLLKDAAGKRTAVALIAAAEKHERLATVISIAKDAKEPPSTRSAAMHALGRLKDADATPGRALRDIITDEKEPLPLRVEAVRSFPREPAWLFVSMHGVATDGKKYPQELRQAVVAAFAGHKGASELLLEMYTHKQLGDDLTPDLARLLRESPFPEIKKQARKLLPAPPKLDPKNLPSIPALLARRGSVERGEQIMRATQKNDAQCLRCHTINGTGGQIGPDLSTIGSKASRENLLESILYPSRAIAHQYESWIVETKGGLAVTGLIVEETPDHFILRDSTGKDFKIGTKDVDSKAKSKLSLMPDNLIVHIPEADLVDMVEYLYSLKNPPVVPTSRREPAESRLRLAFAVSARAG
jgi:putative membrane-bound dehydrogenase-like protein